MPLAATTVPANRVATSGPIRSTNPATRRATSIATAARSPTLRDSQGPAGASAPKQNTGTAVKTAAPVGDSERPLRRGSSSGPTLATAGRTLAATTSPATANPSCDAGAAVQAIRAGRRLVRVSGRSSVVRQVQLGKVR